MGILIVFVGNLLTAQNGIEESPIATDPIKTSIEDDQNEQEEQSDPKSPSIAKRPIVIPPAPQLDRSTQPIPPPRPNSDGVVMPSSGLRALIQDFQTARETYMAQRRDLLRQIKEASAEERNAIRQQLKEKLDLWLQEQKDHIQTIRDQANDMKNNLPALREVIDAAKEKGRTR